MGKNLITLLFAFTLIASAQWHLDFDEQFASASGGVVLTNGTISVIMTSANTPSPYVASASSTYSTFYPWKAFDGSAIGLNFWDSYPATNVLLRLDTGTSTKKATSYKIYPWASAPQYTPKNWTFEGSNDGTSFTVLDTQVNQTSWVYNTYREFTFSNVNAYRYYRINITLGNTIDEIAIGELIINGLIP